MFAALKSLNLLNAEYGIRFEAVLTDNGAEAASRGNVEGHPVERLLGELGIKHRYTRPYRPQTNGKVERFWRTLNEELLEGTTFETAEELREELALYLLYYNTARPHQGLGGKTPLQALQDLSTNYLTSTGMTARSMGMTTRPWRVGVTNGREIPAYAGMTITEGELDASADDTSQETGRVAPRLPIPPGPSSFPRKREPTGCASPTRKREPAGEPSAYAKAGTYRRIARLRGNDN